MFFIDDSGKREFPIGKKYVDDLKKYLDAGNEIEPQFTVEELAAKETEAIEAEKIAYIGLRLSKYPPIGDQLDYIYHRGIAAWKTDMITPVKEKYPKPT